MKATLNDGTVLEGQPGEIVEAIRELSQRRNPVVINGRRGSAGNTQSAASAVWTDQNVKSLWGFLYGKQKELVRFLVQRGGKASIQEVIKELKLAKSTEVAGLRSCITRNARRETGYKKAELIAWERTPKGEWQYRINADALSVLKELV